MLGTNGPCWIVQACWSDPSEEDKEKFDPPYDPYWAIGHYDLVPSMTFQEPDGDTQWRIYAGRTTWRNEAFNELLASIAADEAAPTLWMSQETGAVFAPYDGGVDRSSIQTPSETN